ncbi:hypothetical protein NDU88_001068 [Pleurodeles waltl]|uniref:Uncharacterized protein n=1 Tax=Pleurodeles waltl TaxID=8319 RepID=A0AAV7KRM9_PLEWA|nr:hypothetical protein NDU88_001068 [Pleurodeles waltl]
MSIHRCLLPSTKQVDVEALQPVDIEDLFNLLKATGGKKKEKRTIVCLITDRDDLQTDQIYQPGVGLQWDMKQTASKSTQTEERNPKERRDVSIQTLEEEISRNRFTSSRAKKKTKNK